MARFEVFRMRGGELVLLDLQSNLLDVLPTRIVAPLYPVTEMSWSASRLNPRFEIEGVLHVMATQRMASINRDELGPRIADLSHRSDEITAATDFLFQGF
jgi:toxin CcdB